MVLKCSARYFLDLYRSKRLQLIVFDEVHKILTDSSFRDSFDNFDVLQKVSTPILGLSATIPPCLMDEFIARTRTSWFPIRTSTSRPEFKYFVVKVRKGKLYSTIASHVKKRMAESDDEYKIIVFCRSIADATACADACGVEAYTASTDLELRVSLMSDWILGKQRIMVSTSILGCGLDVPNVREVVHANPSHTMLDQYQEDSRGGRGGESCRVTTYVEEGFKFYTTDGQMGKQELLDWVKTLQCRRIIPSLYLDGVATECLLLPGAELCDVCEVLLAHTPPTHPRRLPVIRKSFDTAGRDKAPLSNTDSQSMARYAKIINLFRI